MSEAVYYFTGKAKWVKDKPNKWGKWDMSFYPSDKTTREALKATGIKNKPQIDAETDEVFFILRNDKQPYGILGGDGEPLGKLVGNGSEVTVKLWVETFNSPVHGPQARSRLEDVVVNTLIEYTPPVKEAEATATATVELPA